MVIKAMIALGACLISCSIFSSDAVPIPEGYWCCDRTRYSMDSINKTPQELRDERINGDPTNQHIFREQDDAVYPDPGRDSSGD